MLKPFILITLISAPFTLGKNVPHSDFYISPTGSDNNTGSKTSPFKSLTKAIAVSRKAQTQTKNLILYPGIYELQSSLKLDQRDNGLRLQALDPKHAPRLIGGHKIPVLNPVPTSDRPNALPQQSLKNVRYADLGSLGIENTGEHKTLGFGHGGSTAMEVFINGQRQTLARYPNRGWHTIKSIPDGKNGNRITSHISQTRLKQWSKESNPWLYGYWYHGWADRFLPIQSIQPDEQQLILGQAKHYGLRKGQRFFAQNLLCELDSPGEYYIDKRKGLLYVWPEDSDTNEVLVSTFESPLLHIQNSNNIQIKHIHFEVGRSHGILIEHSTKIQVNQCQVRNLGDTGIVIQKGKECTISRCIVNNTGACGVSVQGGERQTLQAGNHVIESNHIHHISRIRRTYTPAVALNGVGNHVRNNLIHHAPHQAISFNGNDHLIERNEIHHVVLETDDSGAIYTCPRDYTSRGTIIRHNHLHHSGPHFATKTPASLRTEKHVVYEPMHRHGTSLIYLDDLTGGMTIEGNILEGAYRGMLIGGGRDNLIQGNLILGGNIGIWIDGRGLGWAAKHVAKGGPHGFYRKYAAIKGDAPPFSTRYPQLVNVLTDNPAAPVNTIARSNIIIGAKAWKKTDRKSDRFIRFEQNIHIPPSKNTPIPSAEKALLSLPDQQRKDIAFPPIPFDRIGLKSS
ncbi:right-handed parallel beta-helix repeat-containing protein [Verrucomicrobiaceae bacterium N1E253]|uniref:Right-handed parallel beta-helix repeat-containing protein n=1 Tax=Oceaniferula marina TaxID=2748318 RepID=A0A851GP93_9BACT|nr:right-handed parallel beta-helix repeat-containing protein [Oceaniferula marina]NWK56650.1 right-handed parallel beta-helix repeat-containing protein [Oceaniferula marina]